MLTSGSDSFWLYPPKRLETTIFLDSYEISHTQPSNSFYTSNFPGTVTPKVCTRSSSVFQSPSSSDSEQDLYSDQLILIKDRHVTLKTYLASIKSQLQQSLNVAIAELQGKRSVLIAKVDFLYEESLNKLCGIYKEKEDKIEAKEKEVERAIENIERARGNLKGLRESEGSMNELQAGLKVWVNESDVGDDWGVVKKVGFCYDIVKKREMAEDKENDSRKCRHKAHREKKINDSSKIRIHRELVDRLSKLEMVVQSKGEYEAKRKGKIVRISTLYNASDESPLRSGKIKVHIPQGFPKYSCFYLIEISPAANIGDLIKAIKSHMCIESSLSLHTDLHSKGLDLKIKATDFIDTTLYLKKSND